MIAQKRLSEIDSLRGDVAISTTRIRHVFEACKPPIRNYKILNSLFEQFLKKNMVICTIKLEKKNLFSLSHKLADKNKHSSDSESEPDGADLKNLYTLSLLPPRPKDIFSKKIWIIASPSAEKGEGCPQEAKLAR